MKKRLGILCAAAISVAAVGALLMSHARTAGSSGESSGAEAEVEPVAQYERGFEVEVLVNGRSLEEYYAHGRTYVEAIEGEEYEVRVRNPLPYRVAVALSVDGLNSIDARRSTAWNASKWVIGPYQTISVSGWQMSAERARRFYFTSESDSYAAKLGQPANLGVVSAVFFRELKPEPITVTPRPRPRYEEDGAKERKSESRSPSAGSSSADSQSSVGRDAPAAAPDDEYAATGIGRSVRNDVRWVDLQLERRPAAEVTIRYEYYPALVRLGIRPRSYTRPDPLRRREDARGFEERRFSPEP